MIINRLHIFLYSISKVSLFSLLIILLFLSCKKDTIGVDKTIIEHDTIQRAWNQVKETYYFFDQDITNSFVSNSKILFTLKGGGAFGYDSTNNQWSDNYSSLGGVYESITSPVNKDFYLQVLQINLK